MHDVVGWSCAVCGAEVDLTASRPWRCGNSTLADRHHVLHAVRTPVLSPSVPSDRPFIRYDGRLGWAAAAAARGMTAAARTALVEQLDESLIRVAGVGFAITPFERSGELSDVLGFAEDGGVWVKDETNGVGGSHKARHLFSILLHLRSLELLDQLHERPRLAIASCGNAALAAATLARAAAWPIDVYVPATMDEGFAGPLSDLGATMHRCERRSTDVLGDPTMSRFRNALDRGAVPFTVQGPENALCLDGGRTIGWEIAEQTIADSGPGRLDAMFVQVGGGALAASLGGALLESGVDAPLVAVQAAGCAPFARAVELARGVDEPGRAWSQLMRPWIEPMSLADGILDDETYDWLGVLDVVNRSGGQSVVAAEENIVEAHRLATLAGFDASPTGTAGLAGLLQVGGAGDGGLTPSSRVGIVLSGVAR